MRIYFLLNRGSNARLGTAFRNIRFANPRIWFEKLFENEVTLRITPWHKQKSRSQEPFFRIRTGGLLPTNAC
jgi:hypothetical protein